MIVFTNDNLINVGKNRIIDDNGNFIGYKQAKSGITYPFRVMEDGFSWNYNFGTAKRFMDFIMSARILRRLCLGDELLSHKI